MEEEIKLFDTEGEKKLEWDLGKERKEDGSELVEEFELKKMRKRVKDRIWSEEGVVKDEKLWRIKKWV